MIREIQNASRAFRFLTQKSSLAELCITYLEPLGKAL